MFKVKSLILILLLITSNLFSQVVTIPSYYTEDKTLSDSLFEIIKSVHLDSTFNVGEDGTEQISFAVIDLMGKKPILGEFIMTTLFIPPAFIKCMLQWKF